MDLFGLRVKLSPVTTSLNTLKVGAIRIRITVFIHQLTRYITKTKHKLKFSKNFQQNNLTLHFVTGLETAKKLVIWFI